MAGQQANQPGAVDRFHEMVVEPGLLRRRSVGRLAVAGHRHQQCMLDGGQGAQAPRQLVAVEIGQADVEQAGDEGLPLLSSGRVVANRLPRLGPSLVALTAPPSSSTRCFTSAKPIPSPPWSTIGPMVDQISGQLDGAPSEVADQSVARSKLTISPSCGK